MDLSVPYWSTPRRQQIKQNLSFTHFISFAARKSLNHLLLSHLTLQTTFPPLSSPPHTLTHTFTMATNGTSVKGQLPYVSMPKSLPCHVTGIGVPNNIEDTLLTSPVSSTSVPADFSSPPSLLVRVTPTRSLIRSPMPSSTPA